MLRGKHANLELPIAITGWIHNHARKNYWRVAAYYEMDDLIADGLMCAYKVRDRYETGRKILDDKHFMALVKTTFCNHIGDLLRRRRAVNDSSIHLADMAEDETAALDLLSSSDLGEAEFSTMLNDMPEHLRRVVELYLRCPEKIRQRMRERLRDRETMPERLKRLANFPEELDFETELRSFIWRRQQEVKERQENPWAWVAAITREAAAEV